MIKLMDAENAQYYFILVGNNGEPVMTSKMYERKDVARDTADAVEEMDFSVGDFTRRKKPGPKPKDEYLDFENNGEKKNKKPLAEN